MDEDVTAFGFHVRNPDDPLVIELWGELDVLATRHLSTRLACLARGTAGDLVLDLRPVTFIDCGGLSLLCVLRRQVLALRHGQVSLVIDNPRFVHLLRLVRLSDAFPVTDRLPAAALRALGMADHDAGGDVVDRGATA
ncbi:hypothetical protein GCM10010129_59580 [Streptomyces fumigatiscleroticus]|nr:hypothetical protein GCM10010129_59580 [Streptomyces fumigatiscleroticus]